MNLSDVFRSECINVEFEAEDKEAILREIARLTKKNKAADAATEDEIFDALWEREELGSTGFGDGIAIPHCRMADVSEFVVGMVTVPNGVGFDALDDELVKLFMFIVGPESESKEHVRVLSSISRVLAIPGSINEIMASHNPQTCLEAFLRHVKDEVETKDHDSKNLMMLFIQEEDLFQDLLKVYTSSESCSFMVVESQNASAYLANMPLFAGFWSDSRVAFSRIIVASVEKKLTNEMIRAIERVSGPLDDRNDLMLLVQNLFYAAGSLGD